MASKPNTRKPEVVKAKTSARLKREPGRPLYAQVEEIIRKRLIENYWKPGMRCRASSNSPKSFP